MNYYGQICLSDIPKRLIRDYNGKKYLSIEVVERKQVGEKGDTHFISAYCKKDDRIDGEKRIFGNLKPSSYDNNPQQVQVQQSAPLSAGAYNDNLPF